MALMVTMAIKTRTMIVKPVVAPAAGRALSRT
jgi:hypothetical protein